MFLSSIWEGVFFPPSSSPRKKRVLNDIKKAFLMFFPYTHDKCGVIFGSLSLHSLTFYTCRICSSRKGLTLTEDGAATFLKAWAGRKYLSVIPYSFTEIVCRNKWGGGL
ncbi:hypothetical protein TNIN_486381 [Trichonephila inaurata madagascariensis]|uniref:Uncharacterized protein n=1 Tax=Trichonephila inaurata madagascariensis TaxID=2747483 RepID=A0A8X6YF48_9ARAC|nr:hypothetical protein TNIN_486381 [Trichonephila inaurata madagascariensis]